MFLVLVATHVLAAVFAAGFFHPDEHFQILETISALRGESAFTDLPWEFSHHMRPAMPVIVGWAFAEFLDLFGWYEPNFLAALLRMLAAGLGLFASILVARLMAERSLSIETARWVWVWTCLLWVLPLLHARYSSESLSGSLFFLGAVYLVRDRPALAGSLLMAAVVNRPQVAAMVFGLGVWWLWQSKPLNRSVGIALGAAVAVMLSEVLFARWVYGEWVVTAWNNFAVNILADRASDFGVSPWWGYLPLALEDIVFPFSILFFVGVLVLIWKHPRHWLTWSIVPFVALHFAIGHKELRFLFPMVTALPVVLAVWFGVGWPRFNKVLIGLSVVMLPVILMPMDSVPKFARYISSMAQPDRIYSVDKNPFTRLDLNINFYYQRNPRAFSLVKHPGEINEETYLFFHHRIELPEAFSGETCTLRYSALPSWVDPLDFNQWQSRAEVWRLYSCERSRRSHHVHKVDSWSAILPPANI